MRQANWLQQFQRNITSQHGEDGMIEKIFEIIGTSNRWCVEFGAWDGKYLSNTWYLIKNRKWKSVQIEANSNKFLELQKTYEEDNVVSFCGVVGIESSVMFLDDYLGKTDIPINFDFLSIDVDGIDYQIWDSLSEYFPNVVCIECCPDCRNGEFHIHDEEYNKHIGSSLASIMDLGKKKGYELVGTIGVNAFFVRKELYALFGLETNDISKYEIYTTADRPTVIFIPTIIFIIPNMAWLYDYKSQFPLGILYIAMKFKEFGWNIRIWDTNIESIKDVPKADVYAFSAVYNTSLDIIRLAKWLRQNMSGQIIAGGVGVTLEPSKFIRYFDSLFIGESENQIKNYIADFRNASVKKMYEQKEMVDVSKVFPNRDFLEDSYVRTDSIFTDGDGFCKGGSTSIMFSRGCPSSCIFCCSPKLYNRKIRFRTVDSIIQEIKDIISKYKIRQFRVQDDTFTLNKSFLQELTKELKLLDIYYRCSTRADRVTEEILEMLYNSGCREIGIGVEVADNEILRKLKKNETIEQIIRAVYLIKKYSMKVRCFFMLGLPFDTEELMEKNIRFIEDNLIDNAVVCNFIPFPGTEVYENLSDFGITGIRKNSCMNIASHIPLVPNIQLEHMTKKEHIKIMKIFYLYLIRKGFII